jgi:hypothetical protein
MVDVFNGPIPGESLTAEPGNYPWEQPPLHADPMDALEYHMEQLTDEAVTDNVLGMIDLGVPISVITSTMLRTAVMEGIHSVDVKMLLMPALTLQLKALAEVAGIDYKETMDDYTDKDTVNTIETRRRIAAKLDVQSKLKGKPKDKGDMLEEDVAEMLMEEEETQEAAMIEEQAPAEGIMSKEQM